MGSLLWVPSPQVHIIGVKLFGAELQWGLQIRFLACNLYITILTVIKKGFFSLLYVLSAAPQLSSVNGLWVLGRNVCVCVCLCPDYLVKHALLKCGRWIAQYPKTCRVDCEAVRLRGLSLRKKLIDLDL